MGYKYAGYKELLAIEWDDNAVETFKLNFPEIPIWQRDIRKVEGKEILDFCHIKKGELDLLDGSPPCQGFSTAGKRQVIDKRNDLINENIRLIEELEPKVFVLENVSGMIKGRMKGLFIGYIKKMKSLDYRVKCKLMNVKYYNVPQSRLRVIFIGIRKDLVIEPSYPKGSKNLITVKEAIGYLPLGNPGKHEIQVIKAWHKSKPGQSLRRAAGHVGSFQSHRLDPNKPSVTQISKHLNWHYIIPRHITIQEAAILQSFPEDYKFIGSISKNKERIGNLVPPLFMKAVAENIRINILEKAVKINGRI